MNSLSPIFSSDRPIQEEQVTFVVDTSILIEFQSINRIDWGLLCPRAKSVRIVVPATVIREMDKHKKGTGRLRRRASEFHKLLQAIEDGDGKNVKLESSAVELSLMLMTRYARRELPEEKLSFEIADDLIVAEAVKFSGVHAEAVFLADDSNARRTAREMGIRVARPDEQWRRAEPRDCRDARIEELERQVGARPRLSLGLHEEQEDAVVFETLREREVSGEFCERVGQAILKRNPGIEREELLRRYNLQSSGFNLHVEAWSVTVEQVDRYCSEYEQYGREVSAWSRQLPETISQLGFSAPMRLEISNDGDAFAEDVEVKITASKGYGFLATDFVQSLLKTGSEAPKPPSGIERLTSLPSFFEQQELHRRDPFGFYLGNTSDGNKFLSDITYECQRLRHGRSTVLSSILFKEAGAPSGGNLIVRVSSASLADAVEVRYPIRVRPAGESVDFSNHVHRRLFFFPEDVRDAIMQVLSDN